MSEETAIERKNKKRRNSENFNLKYLIIKAETPRKVSPLFFVRLRLNYAALFVLFGPIVLIIILDHRILDDIKLSALLIECNNEGGIAAKVYVDLLGIIASAVP